MMLYTVNLVSLAIMKTFFFNEIQLVEALANDSLVGECGVVLGLWQGDGGAAFPGLDPVRRACVAQRMGATVKSWGVCIPESWCGCCICRPSSVIFSC